MIPRTLFYLFLWACAPCLATVAFAQSEAQIPADNDPAKPMIDDAIVAIRNKNIDGAMIKLDAAIKTNPRSNTALVLRGCIYGTKKQWAQAEADFQAAEVVVPNDAQVRLLLADVRFSQKDYDTARTRYLMLVHDPDKGDLASFQVFMCDMGAGHQDAAAKEYAVFNQAGENPSYYFSNAVWSLAHKNVSDAKDWLNSASRIYPPAKNSPYIQGMVNLGYLPLPAN
jgi:Tfp pilus assembly protein PilF